MFHRIFEDGLAHSSYVIACDRTRQAVVLDPRRDIDVYVELERRYNLQLALAIETHVHADFVSGARELSERGARALTGPGANVQFDHDEACDGEVVKVGDITLTMLHTPGHTPEHISVLVAQPREPVRVFTGDTLFVGAVGRPDLLGEDRARELAGELYVSIFERLLALPDEVQIYPAHGAGSLCGTGIGRESHSTIGQERRFNPMLQHRSKEAFVEAVLRDLPETPPSFRELKQINQRGPAVLGLGSGLPPIAALTAGDSALALRSGAVLIDLRQSGAFASGHPSGALNIGFGQKVGYWAGWVVPLGSRVVLLSDNGVRQVHEAQRQLLRVGIDNIVGYVDGGFAAWRTAGLPVAQLTQIAARELHAKENSGRPLAVLDVRTREEFATGHVPGAVNIPVGALPARAGQIPRDRPVVTICEGGYRSALAASLLSRDGFAPIINVVDGMTAYRAEH